MKKIAIIEDEPLMREELADMLKREGFSVLPVTDFEGAVSILAASDCDLVLLDLNLPSISGFTLCRSLKQKTTLPVLVLTSRDQLTDELQALELGADEYLTKPYHKERLLARITNVLKRYEGRKNLLEGDGFLLDKQTYTLYLQDRSVLLPPRQGLLLQMLLENRGNTVSREALTKGLWGTTTYIDENALQVNLTRLKKLMAELHMPVCIQSVRGVGYRLEGESHE